MKRNNQRGAQKPQSLQAVAKSNRSVMGMVAAMLGMFGGQDNLYTGESSNGLYGRTVGKVVPPWRKNGHHPHQGEQERARRRRKQIERGTLTASNGLVLN